MGLSFPSISLSHHVPLNVPNTYNINWLRMLKEIRGDEKPTFTVAPSYVAGPGPWLRGDLEAGGSQICCGGDGCGASECQFPEKVMADSARL